MAIDIKDTTGVCCKCGKTAGSRRGQFSKSYSFLYKGTGYLAICKDCVESIYKTYLAQCGNPKDAIRQVCRKLDLYWNEVAYETIEKRSAPHAMIINYIARLNNVNYAGKCYDDTLLEDGTLWSWKDTEQVNNSNANPNAATTICSDEDYVVTEEVAAFWGSGYTPSMYKDLEQRRNYLMSRFPKDVEIDIGTEALIRQICNLEIDINRDRMAGKSIEKSVNALNSLLGSASLKPTQKKSGEDASIYNTPMGVWIDRYEYKRPIPDDETDENKNYLKKYLLAWFGGHLSKMFGIKNTNTKLYDEEIAKYRVCRPEFDDDSDDDMMYGILSDVEYSEEVLSEIGGDDMYDED